MGWVKSRPSSPWAEFKTKQKLSKLLSQ
ncbi:unnamed protein product, partial [Rotaria sp. Silwood2]